MVWVRAMRARSSDTNASERNRESGETMKHLSLSRARSSNP